MNKFYMYILFLLILSCHKNDEKKELFDTNLNDSIYEDFDLYSFEPINKIHNTANDSESYLSYSKSKDSIKIRLIIDNKKENVILKKNKKGQYSYLRKYEQDYIKEFLYTIFERDKILTFVLNKKGDESKMNLTSFRVLFPIDKNTLQQRELIYKLENSIEVEDFNLIETNVFLKYIDNNFESEYYYKFNYIHRICFKYYKNESSEMILEAKYQTFNSKSTASPYFYFWKQINN